MEEISQEELYACLYVFTRLRGLLEKFIYEIRTSGGRSFPSLGTTQQNICTKYAQFSRFSNKLEV